MEIFYDAAGKRMHNIGHNRADNGSVYLFLIDPPVFQHVADKNPIFIRSPAVAGSHTEGSF